MAAFRCDFLDISGDVAFDLVITTKDVAIATRCAWSIFHASQKKPIYHLKEFEIWEGPTRVWPEPVRH